VKDSARTMDQLVEEIGKLRQRNNELEVIEAERKRTEETLRQGEEEYHDLVENINDLVQSVASDGSIVFVNRAWRETLGYGENEIHSLSLCDIIHPESRPHCMEMFQRVMAGEKLEHVEAKFVTKYGRTIMVEGSVNCRFVDGKPVATRGIFRNTTDRKWVTRSLWRGVARLRTVLSQMPVILWSADRSGLLTVAEGRGLAGLGLEPRDLIGRPTSRLHPSLPHTAEQFRHALAGERQMFVAESGGRAFEVRLTPLSDSTGEVTGIVGVSTDITERKKAKEELLHAHAALAQRAAELAHANAELEQYAYAVSHDIRAPLRAIHNYADFLLEDLAEVVRGDDREYLDGLGHAVRQAEELVHDLLELSRVGKQDLEYEPVDMRVFLGNLVGSLGLPASVEVVLGDGLPTIGTEPTLLRQVFQNLIENAARFNDSERKRVELGHSPAQNGRCELFVRDNGIGIDPRHKEQIFRMFHRLHPASEYEGTGIGLTIARKAVRRLDGSIRVRSKLGEGSTFVVTLPGAQQEEGHG